MTFHDSASGGEQQPSLGGEPPSEVAMDATHQRADALLLVVSRDVGGEGQESQAEDCMTRLPAGPIAPPAAGIQLQSVPTGTRPRAPGRGRWKARSAARLPGRPARRR